MLAAMAAQQAAQQAALQQVGLDTPRLWASMIGMASDDQNGVVALVFRDGVNVTFEATQLDGSTITQNQQAQRAVATIMLPRSVVKQFVDGVSAHFKAQDTETNG